MYGTTGTRAARVSIGGRIDCDAAGGCAGVG